MSKAVVAVVGRPNVQIHPVQPHHRPPEAVVENIPGVTRDRLYGIGEWNGREFTVIDTGDWPTTRAIRWRRASGPG